MLDPFVEAPFLGSPQVTSVTLLHYFEMHILEGPIRGTLLLKDGFEFLPAVRIEPGTAGWKAQMLPLGLGHAIPLL